MGMERKLAPDHEVIVYRPSESFRWNVHDYPHHLAKWHHHPEYELHLIQASSGTMMVGDHVEPFSEGCLVLTGPHVPHNWMSDVPPGVSSQTATCWCSSRRNSPTAVRLLRRVRGDSHIVRRGGLRARLFRAHRAGGRRAAAPDRRGYGAGRLVLFLDLLTLLAARPSERRSLSRRLPTPARSQLEERIETALDYIRENYISEIRLADVAALCGMEPTAFSRWFKKQTGHTFAKFVNRTRVYSACTRLMETDQPITDICFEVGFNNIANFNANSRNSASRRRPPIAVARAWWRRRCRRSLAT